MQNVRNIAIAVYLAVFATLLFPLVAHTCSIVHRTVRVGREFRVRAVDHGRPVEAFRVVIFRANNPSTSAEGHAIYALTDKHGYARFANLEPGSFFLTVDHDAGVPDGVNLDVTSEIASDMTVTLQWPSKSPLTVQSVRGAVLTPDFYPSQVQYVVSLSPLEGISGRVIATVDTDSKGRFNFDEDVPPGIYFLRLGPPSGSGEGRPLEGLIAIEVNRKAKRTELNLDVGWTSCGLVYTEGVKYSEMTVSRICGDVTDVQGGAVPNAQVLLLGSGDAAEVVDQIRSERNGQFDFQAQREGTYQLLVKSPGFRPYLRVIHVQHGEASQGCPQSIHVRLGLL